MLHASEGHGRVRSSVRHLCWCTANGERPARHADGEVHLRGVPRLNETASTRGDSLLGVRMARGARGVDGCGEGRGVLRMRTDGGRSAVGVILRRLESGFVADETGSGGTDG